MFNLNKVNKEGSLRWLAENYDSLPPSKTVIAGITANDIVSAIEFSYYKIKGIKLQNAFVAYNNDKIFYVYVNPSYKNYRRLFLSIVSTIPKGFHVDHILSRNLARHAGYNYVLLCMIPKRVNLKHSSFEKKRVHREASLLIPTVCYADNRIFDKILSRNPTARRSKETVTKGYVLESIPEFGLALNQKGIWNTAFGFHQINEENLLKRISKIEYAPVISNLYR